MKLASPWVRAALGPLTAALVLALALASCGGDEIDLADLDSIPGAEDHPLLSKTVRKPGPPEYVIGRVGGERVGTINNDPRTFNTLTARDGDSRAVIDGLYDFLADYDPYKREFEPNLASFEIQVDEAAGTLRVVYTLRDDLYWTLPGQTREQGVKVTSDDVVFWYNEIEGDPALQQPGYASRFVEMPDGSTKPVTISKIDERRFAFDFPRIVANPILNSNESFGPRYIYEPVKRERGVEGVLNLFSIDTDPKTLPSIGPIHVIEYTPGVRVVQARNPNYWKTDAAGTSLPYGERFVFRIVPDMNTSFLLFQQGETTAYSPRPEDLESLLNRDNPNYTVYNGGRSLGSAFIAFNQNPATMDAAVYSWMSRKEFRQALSSLVPRERIAQQVYRGLAVPAHYFFALANPMFDPEIKLPWTYDPARALTLLEGIGFKRDAEGVMRDPEGRAVAFDLMVGAENNLSLDMMNLFSDELKQVGINGRVKPVDFQALVQSLTETYDWHVATAALGSNYWPEGGSNVWQSSGNFHLWRPLQESPATDWEARVDELYNEGRFSLDPVRRKAVYDEFQRILLDQVPLTYLVHSLSFFALRNGYENVFFDTLGGSDSQFQFLKP